jgi:hypothetical protein
MQQFCCFLLQPLLLVCSYMPLCYQDCSVKRVSELKKKRKENVELDAEWLLSSVNLHRVNDD